MAGVFDWCIARACPRIAPASGRCYIPRVSEPSDAFLREPARRKALRILTIANANYAPTGTTITLRWKAGVYVPVPGMGSLDRMAQEAKADSLFLILLARFAEQGRNVCDKKGVAYAPSLFAKEPEAREQGIQKAHFADAMVRLFKAKRIRLEQYGPPSRGWHRLVIEG